MGTVKFNPAAVMVIAAFDDVPQHLFRVHDHAYRVWQQG